MKQEGDRRCPSKKTRYPFIHSISWGHSDTIRDNESVKISNPMIAVPHYITSEEYLDIERQSSIRHEYRYGLVYAMAGGSDNHDRIGFNFLKVIDTHFGEGSECRFYSGNVKVNYQDKLYYYPDAFVTCDPRDRHDRYLKRYPKVIVEVLSASTEAFDRGEKFEDYQQLTQLAQASRLDEPRIPVALALGSVNCISMKRCVSIKTL
jgi:hypothetical protein